MKHNIYMMMVSVDFDNSSVKKYDILNEVS